MSVKEVPSFYDFISFKPQNIYLSYWNVGLIQLDSSWYNCVIIILHLI